MDSTAQTPGSTLPLPLTNTLPIPPTLLTIIPDTERLLARILLPQSDPSASQTGSISDTPEHKRPLDISGLDDAANPIRVKIGKLRGEVAKLPDMERSVEMQEVEIESLEGRIAKQKEALEKLRDVMRQP